MLVAKWPDEAPERWGDFTESEMACRCGCGALPDTAWMERLQQIRTAVGRPFNVTSGARCPAYNATVSKTGRDGPHTTGLAVDIACESVLAYAIVDEAMKAGVRRIGIQQKGSGRFVHLDVVTGPAVIWTY